jgi:hypothetical protein
MTEDNKETQKDKYVYCSRCKCKYNNDEENLKTDFGYNRLKERYKTCCKCRNKNKQYLNDNPCKKEYHKDYQQHIEVKAQRKERESEIIKCPTCNREFPKATMYQHRRAHSPTFWANKK